MVTLRMSCRGRKMQEGSENTTNYYVLLIVQFVELNVVHLAVSFCQV
jgi:hypothetical protein